MQTPSTTPTETAATASVSGLTRSVPLDQPGQRIVQGHVRPADGRRAGAAVGLGDVAVDGDLPFAQGDHVAHGPQRPTDQTLDLLGAPQLLPLGRLTGDPLPRRAQEHRVLGGHPPLARATHPRRPRTSTEAVPGTRIAPW